MNYSVLSKSPDVSQSKGGHIACQLVNHRHPKKCV